MPPNAEPIPPLRLVPMNGPDIASPAISPGRPATLGRAADCQVCLVHETISRRHAAVVSRERRWSIADLGSRHGTFLNGVRLEPNAPVDLYDGDLVRIGPWTFRAGIGAQRPGGITLSDADGGSERVERVPERELEWATRHRLNLLIECSASINAAANETELVLAALDAAAAGSGYRRAAWIRLNGSEESLEVLGSRTTGGEADRVFSFSRSLIREAARGQVARLLEGADYGHSVANLGIHSALCAPIVLGASTVGLLYFDARGGESAAHPEAAGFCLAIARMCGLALSHLKRAELERRQQRAEADLAAAREAQLLILPPAMGEVLSVRYASLTQPGRTVAGDLFDVVELPEGRVGVCIGDVAGEGIGAGILMATTQSYLHGALTRYGDPAAALEAVNHYLCSRSAMNRFVTMWVGVIEPRTGLVRYVDAGHGHWLLRRRGQPPLRGPTKGGIPVAIEPDYRYRAEELTLGPEDRILLYSDGVLEQRSPQGEQFGAERVAAAVAGSESVEADIRSLFAAVHLFAGTTNLDDDATAASIQLIGG